MKWLTLEWIKKQCRIEPGFTDEDGLLEKYGEAAEDTVLNVLGKTYDEVMDEYGKIPMPVQQASMMLVDLSYQNRTTDVITQLHNTGAFDTLVAPYIRHAYGDVDTVQQEVFTLGSQLKILVEAELPDELKMQDVDFTVVVYNNDEKDKTKTYQKADCILTIYGTYVVLVDSTDLGIGRYLCKLTVDIPDSDYPSGYRKEVVKINPHVTVKG